MKISTIRNLWYGSFDQPVRYRQDDLYPANGAIFLAKALIGAYAGWKVGQSIQIRPQLLQGILVSVAISGAAAIVIDALVDEPDDFTQPLIRYNPWAWLSRCALTSVTMGVLASFGIRSCRDLAGLFLNLSRRHSSLAALKAVPLAPVSCLTAGFSVISVGIAIVNKTTASHDDLGHIG